MVDERVVGVRGVVVVVSVAVGAVARVGERAGVRAVSVALVLVAAGARALVRVGVGLLSAAGA